jgi:ribonuclease P protein component
MSAAFLVLKQRADFLACAGSGFKFVKPSVVIQIRKRASDEHPLAMRVGYTATKTLGNAVVRARVKRRLRAATAQLLPELGVAGCDYVFIGREAAFKGTFDDLIRDMKHALKRLAQQMTESP